MNDCHLRAEIFNAASSITGPIDAVICSNGVASPVTTISYPPVDLEPLIERQSIAHTHPDVFDGDGLKPLCLDAQTVWSRGGTEKM
jgi:hypothetical protein